MAGLLVWIEQQHATSQQPFAVPAISVQSANSVGRGRMQGALESIERLKASHS